MSNDQKKRQVLKSCNTIAVVGLSDKPEKPSHRIATYLQSAGYRIVPINPNLDEVLGEKAYPDLDSVPFPVDLVDVFRNSADAGEVVTEAISMRVPVIWLQLGINIPNLPQLSADSNTICIDKCCIKAEHHRLMN